MNFASAFINLQRGHKIARSTWKGYWHYDKESGMIMIHTKEGVVLPLVETKDILYTLSACACDDWNVVDDREV